MKHEIVRVNEETMYDADFRDQVEDLLDAGFTMLSFAMSPTTGLWRAVLLRQSAGEQQQTPAGVQPD